MLHAVTRRHHTAHRHCPFFFPALAPTSLRTYRDLIERYDQHPERKFAGPDRTPCESSSVGLLTDLPIVSQWVRLIGKEANEIEQIDAGLFESENERMIVYDDGEWDAIRRELTKIPTKELQC